MQFSGINSEERKFFIKIFIVILCKISIILNFKKLKKFRSSLQVRHFFEVENYSSSIRKLPNIKK